MKFACERCGKRFASVDEPAPGRVYRLRCRCGNVIQISGARAAPDDHRAGPSRDRPRIRGAVPAGEGPPPAPAMPSPPPAAPRSLAPTAAGDATWRVHTPDSVSRDEAWRVHTPHAVAHATDPFASRQSAPAAPAAPAAPIPVLDPMSPDRTPPVAGPPASILTPPEILVPSDDPFMVAAAQAEALAASEIVTEHAEDTTGVPIASGPWPLAVDRRERAAEPIAAPRADVGPRRRTVRAVVAVTALAAVASVGALVLTALDEPVAPMTAPAIAPLATTSTSAATAPAPLALAPAVPAPATRPPVVPAPPSPTPPPDAAPGNSATSRGVTAPGAAQKRPPAPSVRASPPQKQIAVAREPERSPAPDASPPQKEPAAPREPEHSTPPEPSSDDVRASGGEGAPPRQRAEAVPTSAPAAPAPGESHHDDAPARNEADGLDPAVMQSVIARNRPALEACIAAALQDPATASHAGRKVDLLILVAPTGKAEAALEDGALDESPFGACVRRAAQRMAFPRFKGEEIGARVVLQMGR